MPGRGPATGDDSSLGVGVDQIGGRIEAHLRKVLSEEVLVAPVGSGGAAIQQTGLGQQDRA